MISPDCDIIGSLILNLVEIDCLLVRELELAALQSLDGVEVGGLEAANGADTQQNEEEEHCGGDHGGAQARHGLDDLGNEGRQAGLFWWALRHGLREVEQTRGAETRALIPVFDEGEQVDVLLIRLLN